jgi:Acyltransferase family
VRAYGTVAHIFRPRNEPLNIAVMLQAQAPKHDIPMTPDAQSNERLYFLDWLRILAFAGLVVYHVGMYYVSWDFHVKSPFSGKGLEPWMKLSEPWGMSLIFMISGAGTAYMLKAGPSFALVRRRSAFLLLPLIFGMAIVVPPQAYYQVVQKFNYSGDYLEFLHLYFSRYQGFCSEGRCLILPTWNHLWFLPYLWLYTVLLCRTSHPIPKVPFNACALWRLVQPCHLSRHVFLWGSMRHFGCSLVTVQFNALGRFGTSLSILGDIGLCSSRKSNRTCGCCRLPMEHPCSSICFRKSLLKQRWSVKAKTHGRCFSSVHSSSNNHHRSEPMAATFAITASYRRSFANYFLIRFELLWL